MTGCNLGRIPHHTSAINWILRCGLGQLRNTKKEEDGYVAIIDTSISVSKHKCLIVLRAPLKCLQDKGGAIGLSDVECIGVVVKDEWNGDSVEEALKKVFKKNGNPALIVKDQGSDLKKGVNLWKKSQRGYIGIVDDVGHVVANCLKAKYQKTKRLEQLFRIVNRAGKKLRQTELTGFKPPKLRSKG